MSDIQVPVIAATPAVVTESKRKAEELELPVEAAAVAAPNGDHVVAGEDAEVVEEEVSHMYTLLLLLLPCVPTLFESCHSILDSLQDLSIYSINIYLKPLFFSPFFHLFLSVKARY